MQAVVKSYIKLPYSILADIPRMIPWNHANASILPGFKEMVRSGIFPGLEGKGPGRKSQGRNTRIGLGVGIQGLSVSISYWALCAVEKHAEAPPNRHQ